MVRVTGWGQDGPYADRPGFGTLAEAISGWAHLNGFPENPPTLPPMGLGDAVTSVLGAFATMVALYNRDARGGERSGGRPGDLRVALLSDRPAGDPLRPARGRSRSGRATRCPFVAPRNVYGTRDGRYVALAASTPVIFERVAAAIGRPELIEDERFADNRARLEHQRELDEIIGAWMAREDADARSWTSSSGHEAAMAPVYDIAQIFEDPHFAARGAIVTVEDEELGPTRTADVFPRLIGHAGSRPPPRAHGREPTRTRCSQELGYTNEQIERFRSIGAV